jgi:hypothetical protein
MKMEATCYSESTFDFQQTYCYIRCENLNSYKFRIRLLTEEEKDEEVQKFVGVVNLRLKEAR